MFAHLNYVNLSGQLIPATSASVSHDNRAFRYGYGLFETMLVRKGVIELWHYHAERLFDGLKQLRFDLPTLFNSDRLQEEVLHTVRKNQLDELCRVRLQVSAGSGGLYDSAGKAEYCIECFPLEKHITELNEAGLVTGLAQDLVKSSDSLSNLKSCSALIYATAAQQAKANKWNDALILNTSGNIIESTIANLFWIKDSKVFTPPLSEGCIAGVMRRHLITILPQRGYIVQEQAATKSMLQAADAVFLTNAIRKIKWICRIDETEYAMHMIPDIYNTAFK
ncbi:aminotransferase class IV [Polluticoccus soli]|uniref:aminotransferase class IV n=1 Tax=Polluticoccus soli TaxID=3034150 RepID=UPI0023E23E8F|nr:aminotransferase class IV [Flavipsychrobacter sp. JY13-12]